MNFKTAVDGVCDRIDHEDVAKALGVSLQAVRQARLSPDTRAHRRAPRNWERIILRMAEERVWHYRNLITALRASEKEVVSA